MPELTLVEPGGVQPKAAANAPAAPFGAAPFGGAPLLTTKQAFAILRVSKTKGFALINADILKTVRIGRSRMVTAESLQYVVRHGVDVEQLAGKSNDYLGRERRSRGGQAKAEVGSRSRSKARSKAK